LTIFRVGIEAEPVALGCCFADLQAIELVLGITVVDEEAVPKVTFEETVMIFKKDQRTKIKVP
jgi:hypothetical protein